jgi:hypothetical protein
MAISRELRLGRSKAFQFLDELALTEGKAVSVYFPPEIARSSVETRLGKVFGSIGMPLDIVEKITASKMGAALFRNQQRMCLVLPPFPVKEDYITNGYDVEPLRTLLSHDFLIALVLIRLGAFSVGICQGAKIIDSKTGTGLVHSRHKKGGSSQARFWAEFVVMRGSILSPMPDHWTIWSTVGLELPSSCCESSAYS